MPGMSLIIPTRVAQAIEKERLDSLKKFANRVEQRDRNEPSEPTVDECESHAKVFETEHKVGHAIWYPQMGGYVGKAVAVMDKHWECSDRGGNGGCIDVYVWHDGEFPFSEANGKPAIIHHCSPEQFIDFGKTLTKLNKQGMVKVK